MDLAIIGSGYVGLVTGACFADVGHNVICVDNDLEKGARESAGVLTNYRVIVDKSTVPVKTGEKVAESIKRYNRHGASFDIVSNPEFLREGCAVADLMRPDRIVIGAQSEHAIDLMKKVYEPFMAPILVTDISSAELIKHCANSFLALKISYIIPVSVIRKSRRANVDTVSER